MGDGFGREINYVRLSVTDRCSLRCRYCMGPEGGPWLDRLLSDGELLTICRCLASLGVTRFRVTGGEPLCRPGLPGLIGRIKAIPGVETVSLTTNGLSLAEHLPALLNAGLDGVNISLDTLDRDRFREITRRDALGSAVAGLGAALAHPKLNLKLNCVAAAGREQDWIILAALARDYPLAVRFIEPMPLGPGAELPACTETAVLSALAAAYGPAAPVENGNPGGNPAESGNHAERANPAENANHAERANPAESVNHAESGNPTERHEVEEIPGNGPARYVRFPGFTGKIGFISALTRPFCAACNRVRVTADGFLRTCLYAPDGVDLLPLLSGPEDALRGAVADAIRRKPEAHRFAQDGPARGVRMNRVGG